MYVIKTRTSDTFLFSIIICEMNAERRHSERIHGDYKSSKSKCFTGYPQGSSTGATESTDYVIRSICYY